ncbi:MAG TPA: hypothetical protein VN767_00110 [Streptosporangiaceae bacterium]|nr:hypothetical protein [Streptosporangiaceae bacterium]
MTGTGRTFSPQDFMDKLEHDDLVFLPALTGVIGKAGDREQLMFGDDCSHWTPVPISMIESVEQLDVVTCGKHTHPLVRMLVKEPQSDEARAITRLAISEPIRRARERDDTNEPPIYLGAFTDGRGGERGGRGGRNSGFPRGGGGGFPGGGGGGYGGPDQTLWYGVWCPQDGSFVGSIWLTASQARADAANHNANTGHSAGIYAYIPGS